jgi:hypothetical protein
MHSPLQPLITLPLSYRLYICIYIYLAKCLQGMNRMRKPPLKENRFRRTQGKFNFQAKHQYQIQ